MMPSRVGRKEHKIWTMQQEKLAVSFGHVKRLGWHGNIETVWHL